MYVPKQNVGRIGIALFAMFLAGVPASCFARISIACLLLQFTPTKWWRILLWSTIVLQVLTIFMYEIVQLIQCKSVISDKINISETQCMGAVTVWSFTYANVSKYYPSCTNPMVPRAKSE